MDILLSDAREAQLERQRRNQLIGLLGAIRLIRECPLSSYDCMVAADDASNKVTAGINDRKNQVAALYVLAQHISECEGPGRRSNAVQEELEQRMAEAEALQTEMDSCTPSRLQPHNSPGANHSDVLATLEAFDQY